MARECSRSAPADGPRRAALLGVEHRRALVLLGLGGLGGVARAADALPRLQRELVLAVEAVARVGRRVAPRLALGDGLEVPGGRGAGRGGARRVGPMELAMQVLHARAELARLLAAEARADPAAVEL